MPFDPLSPSSDETLLSRYAGGDPRASAELASRLLPRVLSHAHRMLGDAAEAEDVAQDAMMRLWRVAPDWRRGEAKVSTWLYRVTANLCLDRLRKRRDVLVEADVDPADDALAAEDILQQQDRRDALQAALDTLPDRQRQAVVLRHIEGLANPEIAEIMEISARAVESLTARGKRALTVVLEKRRDELGYEND
ncbi:MAG: RNA polymerase sigma factor [Roseobacter sp.]